MGKLTANEVKAALGKPGTYQDGDGLILKVDKRGGAAWRLRVQHQGQRRDIGLGGARIVTLAQARAKAAEARAAIRVEGRDIVAERREARAAGVTFREAAIALHDAHKHQWANEKHGDQWLATLETYAFPALGMKPVGIVTAGDVIAAIASVWTSKPETGVVSVDLHAARLSERTGSRNVRFPPFAVVRTSTLTPVGDGPLSPDRHRDRTVGYRPLPVMSVERPC